MNEPRPIKIRKRPTAIILTEFPGEKQQYHFHVDSTYSPNKRGGDLGRWNIYYKADSQIN